MARLALLALLALLVAACTQAAPGSNGTTTTTPAEEVAGAPGSQDPPPAGGAEPGDAPPGDPHAGAPEGKPAAPPAADPEGPAILAAHNRFRARHCAPPLSWSTELVKESRRWAKNLAAHRCAFEHNPDPRFGENLAYFRPPGALTQEQVAAEWYREIDGYNFKKPGFSMQAGHFTQLVWVGTRRVGCASVECGGGELWVCNYDPPGNMEGDFDANVRQAGCK